jgi:hypothetical protein
MRLSQLREELHSRLLSKDRLFVEEFVGAIRRLAQRQPCWQVLIVIACADTRKADNVYPLMAHLIQRVTVLGTGLIGGSFALALRGSRRTLKFPDGTALKL